MQSKWTILTLAAALCLTMGAPIRTVTADDAVAPVPTPSPSHHPHAHHKHVHGGKDCTHKAEPHGDHIDYEHDGHHHRKHGDHYDECEGPEADAAKATTQPSAGKPAE